jgi:hypothetical protein
MRTRVSFVRDLRQAARHYKVPFVSALLRSIGLYLRGQFSRKEIIRYGLFVPAIAARYPVLISKERSLACLQAMNPLEEQHRTEDKDEFYRYCQSRELPVPETYGWTIDGRKYDAVGKRIQDAGEWQAYLAAVLPDDFIVKDRAGAYGSGFRTFRRSGTGFLAAGSARILAIGDLASTIEPNVAAGDFILQERLFDVDALTRLAGRRGLQTLRITTMLEKNGRVSVLFYFFKVLAGVQDADNFSMGTSGNLVAYGDREDGILRGAIGIHACGSGTTVFTAHPQTGVAFDGFPIPLWHEAVELVKQAQRCFPMLPTLGWDVALTADGPRIIEANSRWDPPLFAPFLLTAEDWQRIFGSAAG